MEKIAVSFIMVDRGGNLWFSSLDKLYLYSGGRLKSFPDSAGPRGDRIYEIFEDSEGQIWAAASGGLSRHQDGTFVHYPLENSDMVENDCHFILEDSRGQIWTGNSRGLACFDGQRFHAYSTGRLGLTGRTWSRGIKDRHGELWFGSSEGVTVFYPPPVKPNITPPPIYITGVKVMEKEISPLQAGRFGARENIFRFNFVGISFASAGDVTYKYMLENIDTDWQVTRDRSLFYPFLPPGSYALKVKAVNNDGFESIEAAEYRFKILPPYWKSWWFLTFLGLAASLLGVAFIRWRVKRAAERAEIAAGKAELETRNRQLIMSQRMELMGTLAAGTVHDLKNLMTVIITYSQIIGQKRPIEKEDSRNIEIIKRTASTASQMAKQILSFADPKSSDLDDPVDLANELTAILDTVRVSKSSNICIQWEPPPEPIYFPIRPARFQQLVMNLCMNACYAMPAGGELGIYLSRGKDNNIILEITDTGTGIRKEYLEKIFDPLFTTREKGKGTGLGLFVVKQIVNEYDGEIEVRSKPGRGTAFIIRLPSGGAAARLF
jgi:signal transduction histidine kinase